jgi:hypothetical protein
LPSSLLLSLSLSRYLLLIQVSSKCFSLSSRYHPSLSLSLSSHI